MKKKRIIFDLDGTLLTGDYKLENEFFINIFKDQAYLLIDNISNYLNEYEYTHKIYTVELLSEFLTYKCSLNITDKIILEWFNLPYELTDKKEEGIEDLLMHIKRNNVSSAISSNWNGMSQIRRLKACGLYEYFDDIYTGDMALKPHREMYILSQGSYSPDECLFIGDSVEKDYIGPRTCGIESILYDKFNIHSDNIPKVKKLTELKKII